ncbi:hypothetical protein BJX62DRAFT_146313 [Aspergillus germanicus]
MSSIGEDISHFDVLIVGTGPDGLMMAAWLAKCGVKTRIVAQKRDRGFQRTSRRFAIANAELSRSLTCSAFETVYGKNQTICSRIVFGTQTRTESFSAALKRLWRHITSYRRLDWWTAYCTRSANELEHSSPSTSASSSRAMLFIHIDLIASDYHFSGLFSMDEEGIGMDTFKGAFERGICSPVVSPSVIAPVLLSPKTWSRTLLSAHKNSPQKSNWASGCPV